MSTIEPTCVYPSGCVYPGEGCTGPCADKSSPDMQLMQPRTFPDFSQSIDETYLNCGGCGQFDCICCEDGPNDICTTCLVAEHCPTHKPENYVR